MFFRRSAVVDVAAVAVGSQFAPNTHFRKLQTDYRATIQKIEIHGITLNINKLAVSGFWDKQQAEKEQIDGEMKSNNTSSRNSQKV